MPAMFDKKTALLLLGTLAIAVIAGAVTGALGRWFYLVLLSPLLAAVGMGLASHGLVGLLGVHKPKVAGAIGALGGLLTVATILFVTHNLFRASLVSELSGMAGASDAAIERFVSDHMDKATGGAAPALAPLMLRLESGVKLFGETVIDVGFALNGVLLLLEALACVWLGWRLGHDRASELWCTICSHWYERRQVGTAARGAAATIQAELQNQQFHRVGRRMARARPRHKDPVVLHAWMCDTCDVGDVRFELEVAEAGKRPVIVKTIDAPHSALDAVLDSQALKHSA